jgi:hypothetical protein
MAEKRFPPVGIDVWYRIIEKDIKADELANFSSLRLFNAMVEFGECELICYIIRKYNHQVSIHIP